MFNEKLKTAVCAGAKRLASTGVDFIDIPCSSVQWFFNDIQASVVEFQTLIHALIKRGAQTVMAACTDLSVVSVIPQAVPVADVAQTLTQATVREYLEPNKAI